MAEGEKHKQKVEKITQPLEKKGFEVNTEIYLYIEYERPFSAHRISICDILAKREDKTLLVEIEDKEDPSPKLILGDVCTTNLASEYVVDDNDDEPIPISDAKLLVITRKLKEKSKKEEQFSNIKECLELQKGCLEDYEIVPFDNFEETLQESI